MTLILNFAVTDFKLKWNIDNFDEELVIEKPEYGVKLVIPALSVQENQSVDVTMQLIEPHLAVLPPNVQPVSCFYKISTSESFINPIQLHLQHNVNLTSCNDQCKRLAFVTSNGSPPYQLKFCDVNDQLFNPSDKFGLVYISHFSDHVFGIVWQVLDALGEVFYPKRSYAMTPFYKQFDDHNWQIKIVVTQNLGPFLEVYNYLCVFMIFLPLF